MLNRVVLVGRLTRDPELRSTNAGMFVVSFTIAFDEYHGRAENRERKSCFINCTVFGQAAENMSKFTKKGSLVGVDGHLTQRTYDTRDGRRVSVVEIIVDSLQFLERKSEENNNTNDGSSDSSYEAKTEENVEPETNNVDGINVTEDDLPF